MKKILWALVYQDSIIHVYTWLKNVMSMGIFFIEADPDDNVGKFYKVFRVASGWTKMHKHSPL